MPFQTVSIEDVSEFLKIRRDEYITCLDLMKNRIRELMFLPDAEGKIYRVYSRGEKQRNQEFKEDWKIAKVVNEIRKGNKEKKVPAKPNFPIQDLGDIIALTIVCVYNSDKDVVVGLVKSEIKQKKFIKHHGGPKKEGGYYAYHFVLGLTQCKGIRCEVQIKTLLHDAWVAKTHDLTFKPQGELDNRLKEQMEILGDTLASIDQQSELIRSMIQEKWFFDKKRKEAAKHVTLLSLKHEKPPEKKAKAKVYKEILKDLEKNEAIYRETEFGSSQLSKILSKIDSFADDGNYDAYSCHMLANLVCMRRKNDLDNLMVDALDRWIAGSSSTIETVTAVGIKGLSLFCLGRIEEAIQVTKKALKLAQRNDVKKWVILGKGNIAYFLSELADTPVGNKLNAEKNARKYINEALKEAKGTEDEASLKDTLGVVLISFGKTEKDVRQGLQMCKEAFDQNPNKEVATLYFEIHERRAFHQILKWQ